MFNEYRYKNSKQNTDKPNSTTHQKDHMSWTSWIHCRDSMMLQHMQTYKCNTAYKQKQGQKSPDHHNRYREKPLREFSTLS
jgi:hypothetical protein